LVGGLAAIFAITEVLPTASGWRVTAFLAFWPITIPLALIIAMVRE
jgi:hypothetical protein